jgi:FdhD protein
VAVASVTRLAPGSAESDQDLVAVESPLSLLVVDTPASEERPLGLLMRTPGDDADLVFGWLHAEEIIQSPDDVGQVDLLTSTSRDHPDSARIVLAPGVRPDWHRVTRRADATSACGLCGRVALPRMPGVRPVDEPWIDAGIVARLPEQLRRRQAVFAETGGLHAAAVFSTAGEFRAIREDVGRHNAVDKVVGALLQSRALPASDAVLAVSGRVAYEIVQKTAAAGISVLIAVGAPSSLAVEAARAAGMTLIGFVRDDRFNVYTGGSRLRR